MFDMFQNARCLAVVARHAGEIHRLLRNLEERYQIRLSVDELLNLTWQAHLKNLVRRLRDRAGDGFDQVIKSERDNIVQCVRLIKECEFPDFSAAAVLECLRECGLRGATYENIVREGVV